MNSSTALSPLVQALASLTNNDEAYWRTMCDVYPWGFYLLGDGVLSRGSSRPLQRLRSDSPREALEILADRGLVPEEWGYDGRPRWRREEWSGSRAMCSHYMYRDRCPDCNEAEAPASLTHLLSVAALGLDRIKTTEALALETCALTDMPSNVTVGWCTANMKSFYDRYPIWGGLRNDSTSTVWKDDWVGPRYCLREAPRGGARPQRIPEGSRKAPLAEAAAWGVRPWEALTYKNDTGAILYVVVQEQMV